MVNTQLLDFNIKQSGKSKTFLARKCGISVQSFRLKRINKSVFNTDQVDILCDELNIKSLREKERIFFAKNVEDMSTRSEYAKGLSE